MLQRATQLQNCRVLAIDGEIGRVEEVYFEDTRWVIRHLVINAGGWLRGREVLISPYSVRHVDVDARAIAVELDRERIRHSPPIDTDRPVSRQHEAEQYLYYGYPPYWEHSTYWAGGAYPSLLPSIAPSSLPGKVKPAPASVPADTRADVHLRSSSEVTGYRLHAHDGALGHLHDLLFDDKTWAIEALVIDTRNWLPGRHVLLAPQTVRSVNWSDGALTVDRTRAEIREAPDFDAAHLRMTRQGHTRSGEEHSR